ncbi:MAG: acetyl-CoA carboxylase biotin carboxyl carrier protein [Nitrospirae bacterium]|nr:acetyl-CoA carboxylase biotin carboxyl carrier protein [Nitrospirota bacterium]
MNLKELKDLVKFLDDTRFTEVEIEQEGIRVRLAQDLPPTVVAAPPAPMAAPAAQAASVPTAWAVAAPAYDVRIPAENNGRVVTSPIVGTFYRSPGPDKPAYVQVGDTVSKGQVVCIVEAMKLMNEIESDFSGKVAAVLVEDGQPVEFGQPLIRIEP